MPYGIPIRDRMPDRGILRLVVAHTRGVIERCAEVVGGVRSVLSSVPWLSALSALLNVSLG